MKKFFEDEEEDNLAEFKAQIEAHILNAQMWLMSNSLELDSLESVPVEEYISVVQNNIELSKNIIALIDIIKGLEDE